MRNEAHEAAAIRMLGERGLPITFRSAGLSMWPLLRPGDEVCCQPLAGPPRVGDVVIYRADERLVAHRVIGQMPDGWLRLQGDFLAAEDLPIDPARVLGRVVSTTRRGRRTLMTDPLPRLLSRAFPLLRTRLPSLMTAAHRGAQRLLDGTDLAFTSRPLRLVRKLLPYPIEIALATERDATALYHYDRARGRQPDAYLHLLSGGSAREFCLLARTHSGRLAGCIHVIDPPWAKAAGLGGDLWIHDTHVMRRFRGFGIGRALSEAAISELRRRGQASRVRAAIALTNQRSRALYAGLGFAPIGRAHDHDLFELPLAPSETLR